MSAALLLLPDFSLILLGQLVRRWMHLGDHFWSGIEKLVYFLLFPALLVGAILKTPIKIATALPLVGAALCAMLAVMLLALAARRFVGLSPIAFASVFQCGFRFNSYIGLAVAGLFYGTPGVATLGIILGAAVPLANLAAVWMLARQGQVSLLREIARNPLIWATAGGLLLNLLGVQLPAPVAQLLERMGASAVALGLLAVGAALRFDRVPGHLPFNIYLIVLKLAVKPALAFLIGKAFGLSGLALNVLVLFAALPTASSAYILTMRMGGDGGTVAWLISAGTLVSMLTLPLWAAFLL